MKAVVDGIFMLFLRSTHPCSKIKSHSGEYFNS